MFPRGGFSEVTDARSDLFPKSPIFLNARFSSHTVSEVTPSYELTVARFDIIAVFITESLKITFFKPNWTLSMTNAFTARLAN